MCETENYLELLQEINIWEMEMAFAEINSIYDNSCQNAIVVEIGEQS